MFRWLRKKTRDVTNGSLVTETDQLDTRSPHVGALLTAQKRIFDSQTRLTIMDVGVHLGYSSQEYLDAFPNCRVYGFEPESDNFEKATALLTPYGERIRLSKLGLSDTVGKHTLNINSHDGTHSLLKIDKHTYSESYALTL